MHPRLLLSFAVAFVFTVVSLKVKANEAGPLLEKQDLFTAGDAGFSLYRIPGIVVTSKGAVLAYCEARKNTGKDWGEIEVHLRRSTDGGKTWSAAQHIAHKGEKIPLTVKTTQGKVEQTVNNPVMIADRDGSVHFLYCVNYARCFYQRSTDDGVTWSDPVEITAAFDEFKPEYAWNVIATGPGHGIQLRNGRLLVPVWLCNGKDGAHTPSVAATIYSDDQGKTWKRGDIALPDAGEFNDPNETVVAQLSDGRVMLNARSNSKANRRTIVTSEDGATNWTQPRFDAALWDPRCMGSLLALPDVNDNSKPSSRLLFANPHSLKFDAEHHEVPDTGGPRENLTVKLSEDDGQTWTVQKTLEPAGSGYSDLAVLPDGTVLCFYERSKDGLHSVGLLTVARFNQAWLREGVEIKPTTTMQEAGEAIAQSLMNRSTTQSGYMYDLALEGLLELARVTENKSYHERVIQIATKQRGLSPEAPAPWRKQPFSCFTFALYEATQDKKWLPVFIEESTRCKQDIWRDAEGIILHPRGKKRGGGEAMLIDALQEYTARMARTGSVTNNHEWFVECARQFRLYRPIVRYAESGLWSQGRGWISGQPMTLSPGAWSRGHGWLIRGMETSLRYLPHDSAEYREVQGYLKELADALIAVQLSDGMWPCLLTRFADQSPPETSGTAMIAYHIARAIHDGHLTDAKYRDAANKAFKALPKYVLTDGTVLNTSPGPGPLETEEPWLKSSYPPGDPHGTFALLFAAAGDRLLNP